MADGSKNRCPLPSSETPNKRFKTQNLEILPPRPPSSTESESLFSFLKGKSKLEIGTDSNICGICLSEAVQDGNNASRGFIDSCDHYFCFVCIMEWAKVESKCPICKRRFSTIRRPSKYPIFPSERLVLVPVRDQVHHLFGNATTGPLDLHSDAECTVCHSSADESFLLLCDLCDSASHTHCVGLGATVPEGDWFCQDCTLLREEQIKSEVDIESSELNDCENRNSSSKHISVFDIVRGPESPIRRVERSSTSNFSDDKTRMDTNRQASNVQNSTRLSARTLRHRRNVHDHIQALRDNWNSFRSGSLSFSSKNSSSSIQTCEVGSHSAQPESTSSLSERLKSENGPPGPTKNRNIHEIDKAWKMMDIAKSMEQKHERKSIVNQASKNPMSSKHVSTNDQQLRSVSLASIKQEKHSLYHSLVNDNKKHKTQMLERSLSVQGFENCSTGFQISSSPVYRKLTFSQDTRSPLKYDFCDGNGRNLPKRTADVRVPSAASNDCSKSVCLSSLVGPTPVSSNVSHSKIELPACSSCNAEGAKEKGDGNGRNSPKKTTAIRVPSAASNDCTESFCSSSLVGPTPVFSNLSYCKPELPASSSCKIEACKEKVAKEKSPVDLKTKGNNDAKCEIQSLVKLNLKLLAKDKDLGVNTFKEVARVATHSILAACGLEHPKPGILHFPSSVCSHASDGLEIRRSTLMANSCRECFYVFVKDVVNTIMLEKMQSADAS